MNNETEQFFNENGFIEIDYSKPIESQVSIGDELISTDMYIFGGPENDRVLDKEEFIKRGSLFIVSDIGFGIVCFDGCDINDEDSWHDPEGEIFIKKQSIEYIHALIPKHMVEKALKLGAQIPGNP